MTKKTLVTNINEIKHLKVSCQKCGFLIQLPIGKGFPNVKQCIYCQTPIPSNQVQDLMEAIKSLQKTTQKNGDFKDISIEFETEEVE